MVTVTSQEHGPVTLELVAAFVNSLSIENGGDRLDADWLAHNGLLAPGARASARELDRARRVREALRELGGANNGLPADAEGAPAVLDTQARRSRLQARFHGGSWLEPQSGGVDAALGHVLAAVAAAMADGSWRRFKACRAETCRWAFVDGTRNQSRHWCSMEICGNRSKARAYRARNAG
jgi:predicted RNA-binding Zn ribbon-like protein